MFRYNFKIIWRGLSHQKMYSLIKIGGFAIGIAACLMIALYIKYELSYDKQYENGERIYRVVQVQNINGRVIPSTVLQAPLAETMKNEFPEIENAGRLIYFGAGKNQIRRSDSKSNFDESGFVFAEQSIIEIFNLPVLSGSPKEALNEINKIAISKRIADKFFPGEEALGKSF